MRARSQTTGYLAAIACFPLVVLLVNDSWAFPPPERWIDPYIYTGYFQDLVQHLNVFSKAYYGTRLPWILLGAAVHSAMPFELAQYVLRLILFYIAAFSLFATIRMLFRNNVAATMAVFALGADTYFLRAIGWDYVDGCGLALIFVTMASLTAAATRPHWWAWLIGAAVASASMVVTYIMLALIVPFQIAAYLFLNRIHRRNSLAGSLLCAVAGAGAAIGALGAINWALTGRFLFFLPQLRMALEVTERREQWKAASYAWLGGAIWLMIAALATTVALVLLVFLMRRRRKESFTDIDWHGVLAAAFMFGLAVTFVVLEVEGFWLLQYSEYSGYLIPGIFLCIGAAVAFATRKVSPRQGVVLVGAAAVAMIAPLLIEAVHPGIACLHDCQVVGSIGLLAAAGALFFGAAAMLGSAWLTVPAFLALGLVNISVTQRDVVEFPRSRVTRAHALMIPDALAAIRPFNADGNLRIWYDFSEPLGGVFRAVASANLWSYRLVSENFPKRTPPLPEAPVELGLGDTIAVLTASADAMQRAAGGVAELGVRLELLGSRRIARGDEAFSVTIVRLVPPEVDGVSELDLRTLNFAPEARVRAGREGVTVRTSTLPWSYAAQVPIPVPLREQYGECGLAVRINMQVEHGTVGLGVLNAAGTGFVARKPVRHMPSVTDVMLGASRISDAGNIVIQSWDTETEGQIEVSSISLLRHGCPAGD